MTRVDPDYSWEEDRKFILRGWSLVFSILATLMMFSMVDGRMAYLTGSYTGYVGLWTNCRKYRCPNFGQVTVLIHMSTGFMMLALTLCVILLPIMGLSFRPVFRRLNKIDLVFSILSFSTGLLTVLSMTLFVVNCRTLQPRPHVSYLLTTYLGWGGGVLMLWTGILSYLNHVGMWGHASESWDRRMNYRRRATRLSSLRLVSRLQLDADSKQKSEPAQFTPARGDPRQASLSNYFSDTAGPAPLTVVTRKSDLR